MKHLIKLLLLLPCVAGLSLGQDVRFSFDEKADFTKYKTYRWEKHPKSLEADELTMKQLAAGFDAELAKKGLKRTDSDPTDLVIVYQLAMNQEKELTTFNTGWGYGPGWGGWYGGGMGGMTTSTTNTISIGSIALDMYDASAKQLVWRGLASKTLDPKAKQEKREKNISKAAEKMLKNYPPKKK